MLEGNTIIKATNRSGGSIGYRIPDLNNLKRHYSAGETKEVTMEELRKLSYIDGGIEIIKDYLILDNKEAVAELLGQVEPEYYYTSEDIKKLLLEGSLDALKDCLDFAPEGTIEEVKKLAVELKIPDVYKREAIQKSTGLNVSKAIEAAEMPIEPISPMVNRLDNNNNDYIEEKPTQRRVAPQEAITTEKRYTVIK